MLYGQSQVTACTQPVPPCVGSRCADVKTPPVEPLWGGCTHSQRRGVKPPGQDTRNRQVILGTGRFFWCIAFKQRKALE